jgi:hypothetical protein
MKIATALLLLFDLVVAQGAPVAKPDVARPHWVIIATFFDRTTGKQLGQSQLKDPELEFDDPATCESIVERVRPVQNHYVTSVLKCRKVIRMERYL